MPTFFLLDRFKRDWAKLTIGQQQAYKRAVRHFLEDLRSGNGFRPGLRVKRVQGAKSENGTKDIWEMTWAPDGRATWQYGEQVRQGEPHVIWRRIGTHSIFDQP